MENTLAKIFWGGGARNDGLLFEYLEFKDSSIPIHLKIGCFSYGTVSLSYFELPCVLCFRKFEVSLCNVQNIKLQLSLAIIIYTCNKQNIKKCHTSMYLLFSMEEISMVKTLFILLLNHLKKNLILLNQFHKVSENLSNVDSITAFSTPIIFGSIKSRMHTITEPK